MSSLSTFAQTKDVIKVTESRDSPFVGKWRTALNNYFAPEAGKYRSVSLESIVEFKSDGTFNFEKYQYYEWWDDDLPVDKIIDYKLSGLYWIDDDNSIRIANNMNEYKLIGG
jgi:hypothetical protein